MLYGFDEDNPIAVSTVTSAKDDIMVPDKFALFKTIQIKTLVLRYPSIFQNQSLLHYAYLIY